MICSIRLLAAAGLHRRLTARFHLHAMTRHRDANRATIPAGRKKIFSRDEGEYVEFEEIEVTADHHRAPSNQDSAYTPREPQVSDADWEEIR